MTANQEPIFYRSMVESAQDRLIQSGQTQEQAIELASQIAADYCAKFAGEIIRIPSLNSVEKQLRDKQICVDRQTMNVAELCKKYSLGERVIRLITQGVAMTSLWSAVEIDALIDGWGEYGSSVSIDSKTPKQIRDKAYSLGLGSARRKDNAA